MEGEPPPVAASLADGVSNIEVVPGVSGRDPSHRRIDLAEDRAERACVVMESSDDAVAGTESSKFGERFHSAAGLAHRICVVVWIVARLEEGNGELPGRPEQGRGVWVVGTSQVGRDHRQGESLATNGGVGEGKILDCPLGQDVAARPDGQVNAIKPGLFDRFGECLPAEHRQMLGEEADRAGVPIALFR